MRTRPINTRTCNRRDAAMSMESRRPGGCRPRTVNGWGRGTGMESRRPGGGGARTVPGGGAVSAGYCAWNGLECAATNAAFTVAREYDILDRVTNVTYTARDGTPLYRLSYAYDPDGLVTQRVVASASGAVTNSYAYDGLMRLVAESDSPGNSASYVYDPCGNRLSVATPSGTVSSTYTHNRRDADTHDAGGRVTRTVNGRGQVLDLTWNLQGELVSVSTNGVFAEGYAYDALGRRVSTTDASGTVYHAYDGIHCVADLSADGALLRSYTWGSGMDNLLAVTLYSATETNTLYAVTDPLGTVHALVASNGTSQLWFTYDSWGNITVASQPLSFSASQLRFTWQGREYSRATGLYSFRARWYDPASGRWLSKDPIGLEGGLNLYEAFGNNPVCFVDPNGTDRYLDHHWDHTWVSVDVWGKKSGIPVVTGHVRADFLPDGFWGIVLAPTFASGIVKLTKYNFPYPDPDDYYTVQSTPDEDKRMLDILESFKGKTFTYNLFLINCRDFSKRALLFGIGTDDSGMWK